MMCATALLSSCHIYKAYDRPETIDTSGLYRDPVSVTDTLAADTTNMGNLSWKEVFRDPKLQALIEEGLANNVDMQAAVLRVEEAKTLLTAARLSFLPSLNLAPQGSLTTMGGSSYAKAYTCRLLLIGKSTCLVSCSMQAATRKQSICRASIHSRLSVHS